MAQLESIRPGPCWDDLGLSITITKGDEVRCGLRLVGDLDAASAPLLSACLDTEMADGRRFLRLDMSGLAFVDSSGLDVIVAAHSALLKRRGTLILLGLSRATARVITLLGLDRVLLIAADLAPMAVVSA